MGDYTMRLLSELGRIQQRETGFWDASTLHFLLANNVQASKRHYLDASINALPRDSEALARLLDVLKVEQVLLQYDGYCYDSFGAPFYLIDGLRLWHRNKPNRRVLTMFHETWGASGQCLKRCLALLSAIAARRLVLLSDVAATSNDSYRQSLEALAKGKTVSVIPIASNLTVTKRTNNPPQLNWTELLVFGSHRERALKAHSRLLKELCAARIIDRIVLAGATAGNRIWKEKQILERICPDVEVATFFDFPPDEIPEQITSCGLSLMDTGSRLLAKSGRFQFSCCLGQVSIAKDSGSPGPPLEPGRNFLSYKDNQVHELVKSLRSSDILTSVSSASLTASHHFDWTVIAREWLTLLTSTNSIGSD